MKLLHKDLVDLGLLLGYRNIERGVCMGVSCMLMQAIVAQRKQEFDERLDLIASYKQDFNQLKNEIEMAREKLKSKQVLSDKERKLLDISAFYDGILLYLRPHAFANVFHESLSQGHFKEIFLFTKSLALENEELTFLSQSNHAFTKEQLTNYLMDLEKLSSQSPSPIPVLFGSYGHTVLLEYNTTEKCWEYTDTNDFERFQDEKTYHRKLDSQMLAESLFTSLGGEEHVVFHADVMGVSDENTLKLSQDLQTLNDHYPIDALSETMSEYDKTKLFILAAGAGDEEGIAKLLKKPLNYNNFSETGITPFLRACLHGHLKLVELFLREDPKLINQVNELTGQTSLLIACELGYFELANLILEKDLKTLNQKNDAGIAPLFQACLGNHLSVVTLLLQKGAQVNQLSDKGVGPIHHVCATGNKAMLETLLRYNADVTIKNKEQKTPLLIACEYRHDELVAYLLEHNASSLITQPDDKGNTPLYTACKNNAHDMVGLFLSYPLDPNIKLNAFRIAFQLGHYQVMDEFLKKGMDINVDLGMMMTPLMTVAGSFPSKENQQFIQWLIEKGANLASRNALGMTAFDSAYMMGNTAAFGQLLEAARVQKLTNLNLSPLTLNAAMNWAKSNAKPELETYLETLKNNQPSRAAPLINPTGGFNVGLSGLGFFEAPKKDEEKPSDAPKINPKGMGQT